MGSISSPFITQPTHGFDARSLKIRWYVLTKGFPRSNPILGMGFFDHQSYSSEGSGFLGTAQMVVTLSIPNPAGPDVCG